MIGGAEINFWGGREVHLCELERDTGEQKIYSRVDQTKKVKIKIKRSSSKKFNEIRCESKKITKIRAVNTNVGVSGLDLHSNSPEPVNFFGVQSSSGLRNVQSVQIHRAPHTSGGPPFDLSRAEKI